MDNKIEHFVLKEDGRIYWVEKMPDRDAFTLNYNTFERFQDTEYQQALQSAINNAVEVSNFDETEDALLDAHATDHGFRLEVGKIYSLQCSVEKKVGGHSKVIPGEPPWFTPIQQDHTYPVAIVTFSQPEIEEIQEELWDEDLKIDKAIQYFEELRSDRERNREDDTILITTALIILKGIKRDGRK